MAGSPSQQPQYPYGYPQQPYGQPQYGQHAYGQAWDPNAYYNYQQYAQQYANQQHGQTGWGDQGYNANAYYTHGGQPPSDQYGSGYPPAKRQRGNFGGGMRGRGGYQQASQPPVPTDYYNQAYPGYAQQPTVPHASQPYPPPPQVVPPTQGWPAPPQPGWQAPPTHGYPTPAAYPPQQYPPQQPYQYPPAPTQATIPPHMQSQPHFTPPSNAWHAAQHQNPASRGRGGFHPVPVSASSKQWRRPKTPPDAKENVKVEPDQKPDFIKRASSATSTSIAPKGTTSALDNVKKEASTPAAGGQRMSKVTPNPFPGLDYLGEDVADWYHDNDSIDSKLSIGSVVWRPPNQVTSALPSDFDKATEVLERSLSEKTPKSGISQYAQESKWDEQTKPMQTTRFWEEMKDDPIFRDLSRTGQLVPFARIRASRARSALSMRQHQILQHRVADANGVDDTSIGAAYGQGLHMQPTETEQSDLNGQVVPGSNRADADEDDEPYSPPPAESAVVPTPQPKHRNINHKRKFSALDTIVEEQPTPKRTASATYPGYTPDQSKGPDDIQSIIARIEHHSSGGTVDTVQARIEAITHARQIEAERKQVEEADIQARIEAITSGQAPTPSQTPEKPLPINTYQHQRRKSSVSESVYQGQRRNSLPPKEFAKDEQQEDLLAKLGVTGNAKPVFNMPAPARTEPPPGYERRSRSRSRSYSPVKHMTNGLNGVHGLSHHPMHAFPIPPPPPPPPPEPYEASGRPFERPSSALSQRTAVASDFDDAPVQSTESFIPLETISEDKTPNKKQKKRQRSESQEIDAATAQRLFKRPPKVDPAYMRRW